MYLHLGDETVISTRDLIGVFDLDVVTVGNIGRTYLQNAEKSGDLVSVGENIPKSFVVCGKHRGQTVYISPVSTSTLIKRISRGNSGTDDLISEE